MNKCRGVHYVPVFGRLIVAPTIEIYFNPSAKPTPQSFILHHSSFIKKGRSQTVLFSILPHIPFLLLPEHSVADKVLDKNCRQGEKKPYT